MPKILNNPKERILKEAKKMLDTNGYKNFSMRELAKNSNIGLGTVYNYFSNKEAIVRAIIKTDWQNLISELANTNSKNIDFVDKMKFIYDGMDMFFTNHVEIFFELYNSEDKKYSQTKCHNNILEDICSIIDEIISYHLNNNTIELTLKNNLSNFIVSNMIVIIKNKGYTFEDLMTVIIKK